MITTLPFGKTGHTSTRIIFGAAALGSVSQDDADRTLEVLLQYGINHIDVAASYGEAELRIGPWMAQHRNTFFLATKTGERSKEKAREEFHRSLDRLKTDHIDLIQLHNLVDPIEWQTALGPGGALEALVEAREQGLVSFIGVTGHGLSVAAQHIRALGVFDFASVLCPYNYVTLQNAKYAEDFEQLYAICQERNIAMQTIKSIVRRPWALDEEHVTTTWYNPLTEQSDIDAAVHWVLGREGVFLNTASDIHLLPKILDAAARFTQSPGDEAMKAIVEQKELAPLFY